MNWLVLLFGISGISLPGYSAEPAPPAWPRYEAKVIKDHVNFRVEPSLSARLAPVHPAKGQALSVQHSSDPHWLEILDPEEDRGFFVRDDMIVVGVQEPVAAAQ
jgi:hypothetical protein